MNTCGRFLTTALLTIAIASHAFAATTTPAAAQDAKPAAPQAAPSPTTAAPGTAAPPATTAPGATIAPGAASAPAATAPAAAAADQIKIGYVDMVKIGMESSNGKAATESMKAKAAKLKTKIEAKQKQLEKQKAAIEANIGTMSAKERAAKTKEFQKKVEEYQKLVRSSEQEMQQMQDKLTSDIYKVIKRAATSYAKSHGYTAIVEEKGVLYMSDSIEPKDITSEVAATIDQQKTK
jgi:outer membrane protein